MLDGSDEQRSVADALALLPCDIELPAKWNDFFKRTGMLPCMRGDRRRFTRSFHRAQAALEYRQTLPHLARPAIWYCVYTTDITRKSIGFLHSEQLFPGERMRMMLIDGSERIVHVVRCRRIRNRCYDTGARFIDGFDAPLLQD
ncbi:MAG: hypothetical protein WD847_14155 [Pirellulales bacterium]